MKKVYSKPVIVFDNFSLSTNIAGDCEKDVTNSVKGSCGMPADDLEGFESFFIFTSAAEGCTLEMDDGSHNSICYHVPTDQNELFNS